MYVDMKAEERKLEVVLLEAETPTAVRRFEIVRKQQLDEQDEQLDDPPPVKAYAVRPQDYVIQYSHMSASPATPLGSPTKRQKTFMCDERYQRLVVKAQRDWAAVPPVLDESYKLVQDFLYPEPGDDTEDRPLFDDDDLGDPMGFMYDDPEPQDGPDQSDREPQDGPDQSDRETLCVLRVLKEKGELDMQTLLTEVKLKAAELGETDLAELSTDGFELMLLDLAAMELIDCAGVISLSQQGCLRFETLDALVREAKAREAGEEEE